MKLWNFVHYDVGKIFGIEIHAWEFLALICLAVIAIIGLIHHIKRKRTDKKYEEQLDEIAANLTQWDELKKEGASSSDAPADNSGFDFAAERCETGSDGKVGYDGKASPTTVPGGPNK